MPASPDSRFDWLDRLPLPLGPPDLHMGLRALRAEQWLTSDSFTPAELRRKARLLEEHDQLVMLDSGFDGAVDELTELVERHLRRPIDRASRPPLEAIARAVPEDVILMADEGDGWRLVGGALVFPNQWTLAEKMGGTLAEIHEPVDGYAELLSDRVDRFFDRLTAPSVVWRRNWFLHDDPEFFQPEPQPETAFDDPARAGRLFVRSEFQTLRRLASSGVVVFTIKTQQAPISEVATRPELAMSMARFLEAASPRALDNRDALGRERAVIEYLRSALPEASTELQDS